jgi:hypothetical protein
MQELSEIEKRKLWVDVWLLPAKWRLGVLAFTTDAERSASDPERWSWAGWSGSSRCWG